MGVNFSVEKSDKSITRFTDAACFSLIWGLKKNKTKITYFPKKQDSVYVAGLKEMGFQFTEEGKGFVPLIEGVSFTEVLATLTVLRYLEEEKPILESYHQIIKELPEISKWEALQLAHEKGGQFVNSNHTLIVPNCLARYTPWEEVKTRLARLDLWEKSEARCIHDSYGTYGGYSEYSDRYRHKGKTIQQLHEELKRG